MEANTTKGLHQNKNNALRSGLSLLFHVVHLHSVIWFSWLKQMQSCSKCYLVVVQKILFGLGS